MPRKKIHEDRTAYKNQWISENKERVNLVIEKGKKQEYIEHAARHGESLNAFVNRAIAETIINDNEKGRTK